jgi:hypothetical protein
MDDLWKAAIGAIIGFALAQTVNGATLLWNWFYRSKLVIEPIKKNVLLSHSTQTRDGLLSEKYFGFKVRNEGRSVATGVRFQITGIRFLSKGHESLDYLGDMALDLHVYTGAEDKKMGANVITLVPKSGSYIALAWWREDITAVRPCTVDVFDYYDEMASSHDGAEFDVVVFDDSGDFATATIVTEP